MPLPLLIPFLPLPENGFNRHIPVLERILNIVLELNPPLTINEEYDSKSINALNNFKAQYYAKYKQGITD